MSNYYFIYHVIETKINQCFIYNKNSNELGEICRGKITNSFMSYNSCRNIFTKNNGWNTIPINWNTLKDIKLLSKNEMIEHKLLEELKLYEWRI